MCNVPKKMIKTRGRPRGLASLAVAVLVLTACSASPPPGTPPSVAETVRPAASSGPAAAKPDGLLEIQGVEVREETPGAQLEVATSGPLTWTSYRDGEDNLVVELPNSRPGAAVTDLDFAEGMVESARVQVEEGERPLTRLVVRTRTETEHSVAADGSRLLVELTPVAEGRLAALAPRGLLEVTEAPAPLAAISPTWAEPQDDAEIARITGTADEPVPGPAPTGVAATQLLDVAFRSEPDAAVVSILGDGEFYYSTFALSDPERFVVDLKGVVKTAPLATLAVAGNLVERVRVAQFKPQPDLVSRVVIDLTQPALPELVPTSEGLEVRFRKAAPPTLVEEIAGTAVEPAMPEISEPADEEAKAEPVEDEAVSPAAMEPAFEEPVPEPTALEAPALEPVPMLEEPAEPAFEEPAYEEEPVAEATVAEAPLYEPEPVLQEPVEPSYEEPVPEPVPAEEPLYVPEPVAPPVYEPAPVPAAARPAPKVPTAKPAAGGEKSLFDVAQIDVPAQEPDAASSFAARTVGGEGPTWEGEPITMSLKDADIKDVLRSFAQLSGLNVVVQPGVTGTVTVELSNVPWDQALQQVLKINGLDYQLEGNIMRIAPISQLRAEAEEQQRLLRAQALSIPLRTIIRRVSYATAADIARVLKSGGGASIMSQRGSVVVDRRTNTLIIKELPAVINTVIAVIENLDIPEPQVIIEARIIETTKRFSSTLGIDWGFNALADPAHGNTTGLVFPNNVDASGGVQLLTGGRNGFLDISLGNVLNTFRLDAVLQAAENEGLINILSAPKIATLNNERASIQSGLQIPIQTIANNTVSIQFINATLRLDVTPHVTAAGTVLMDIDIQKREPQLAFAVVGASNAPISTKDARTRVIVRDGGTTVIGGIYKVTSDQGEDRVPGLSNVPILKHLFKNKRRNDENEELLIFITPRVVKL